MKSTYASIAYYILKGFAAFVRAVPEGVALWIGRRIGDCAYLSVKNRRKSYKNLRLAFGGKKTPEEIRGILKRFYHAYGMNIVELSWLPRVASRGFAEYVTVDGREHLDEAIKRGRGVIFLSMHSGNWELASLVGSMCGYPYNMVANDMSHLHKLADLINELRQCGGARIINPGLGGRDIIKCLRRNEIVTLVVDQGGKEGMVVPFFGRESSMSTGAIRLALKYDVSIVMVDICRMGNSQRHRLTARLFDPVKTGDTERDVQENLACLAAHYERWLAEHPHEYIWLYKTWKYSRIRQVVVLDDGRTGHLRQSESTAQLLEQVLVRKGYVPKRVTIPIQYRSGFYAALYSFLAGGGFLSGRYSIDVLKWFLERSCYNKVFSVTPDFVISTGSKAAPLNFILSRENMAKSIAILRPGSVPMREFSLLVMPRHDFTPGQAVPDNVVVTQVAPNLIGKDYLEENVRGLLHRYSHLKMNLKNRLGFLVGGDTRGVILSPQQVRVIVHQLKDVAAQFNLDIIVTTSRRTSPEVEQVLFSEFRDYERCALLIIANNSNVPEAVGGILGLSSVVVVSGDSISMVSEAACSGKKVVAFPVDGPQRKPVENKYTSFVDDMASNGYIACAQTKSVGAVVSAVLKNKLPTRPVNDNAVISAALEKMIQ
ncbi:MAG: hypothetical protein HGA80_07140 [Candidatus Omnitrophica bacterium]|nr:hypothetical protein [Candidatus Omnitrophota bacterium]